MNRPGTDLTDFLSFLAVRDRVSASTQKQAPRVLLFLCREALDPDFPWLDELVRAKCPRRLPVVMKCEEVRAVLGHMEGTPRQVACLLHGSGLRTLDVCRLCVKDVDFGRSLLVVRSGRGDMDRLTVLPRSVQPDLCRHLEHVHRQHDADLRTLRELLRHSDVRTTQIHTHVPDRGPSGVRSPVDRLLDE